MAAINWITRALRGGALTNYLKRINFRADLI